MPTAGSEILAYTGNAHLATGLGNEIPVLAPIDNNPIYQMNQDIMRMNHENNILKWKRANDESDRQLDLLDKGQIETGKVLDRDRQWLQQKQKGTDKEFENLVKAKPGTEEYKLAYRKYHQSLTDYKDAVTVAQNNWIDATQLEALKAQTPLKFKQERIQAFKDKELSKPAGSPVGKYVPTLDINTDQIINPGEGAWGGTLSTSVGTPQVKERLTTTSVPGKPTKTVESKTVTSPTGVRAKVQQPVGDIIYKDGLPYSRTKQYFDFDKVQLNKINEYADPGGEQHENQELYRGVYESAPDAISVPAFNHIIQRVKDYNADRGFEEGDKGYINPNTVSQKLGIDPLTGKRVSKLLNMSSPEFAALSALAAHNGSYAPTQDTLLKDQAELGLKTKESQAKIGAINALANQRRANTRLTNKKTSALDNQFNPAQTFDELFKSRTETYKTTNGNWVTRINRSAIPKSFLDNLGIQPLNSNGDYNVVPSNIKFNGKSVPEEDAHRLYDKWLDSDAAKQLQESMGGKTPDIFDFMYANGANFEVDVVGTIKPEYDKSGKVLNPKEAGKITRSNRLQSWINQRKGLGVKGDKLLMEETITDNENVDEQ